jgi:lysozyme family protein
MPSDFSKIISTTLTNEAGYVNDPDDPGGETKFGISKNQYPTLDIKNLTFDDALAIYKKDFWDKYKLGEFDNQELADRVFDMLINTNPIHAISCLQRAIVFCGGQLVIDGVLGTETLLAVNSIAKLQYHIAWLIARFQIERLKFYIRRVDTDKSQREFLLDWVRRTIF